MDPINLGQLPGGSVGYGIGALIAVVYFLDKFFQNRSGDNQRVKALTEDNARLMDRLRDADKDADDQRDRADKAMGERNDMLRELGEIKAQYATINERLDSVSKQNQMLLDQNAKLVEQNQKLTDQINQLLKQGVPNGNL